MNRVWVSSWDVSLADPGLADRQRERYDRWRDRLRPHVTAAVALGELPAALDADDVAASAAAFAHGLVVHALFDPARFPPDRQVAMLDAFLASLNRPPGRTEEARCWSHDDQHARLGADFPAPIDDRYFEDYKEGSVYEYGHVSVTEAEIVEFAHRFDPQPIHTDPDFAATGPFQGIIASGWHTGSLMMRLFADHFLSRVASLASPAWTSCAGRPSGPATHCTCASPSWRPARPAPSPTAASSAPAPSCSTRTTRSS